MVTTTVLLFTRDLRVHDHPALAAACEHADRVVPLFVLDDAIPSGRNAAPNRAAFLAQALADLHERLRERGSDLVLRRGDVARRRWRCRRRPARRRWCAAPTSAATRSAGSTGWPTRARGGACGSRPTPA